MLRRAKSSRPLLNRNRNRVVDGGSLPISRNAVHVHYVVVSAAEDAPVQYAGSIQGNGPNKGQTPTGETQGTNVTCDESYSTQHPDQTPLGFWTKVRQENSM